VIAGYVFFTAVAVSSQRYTIFLVFPLAFFSILAIARCLPARVAGYVALAFAAGSFCYTLVKHPAPHITGYREAAHYVCSVAPADSVVMFSGWRDGSFVFNVRSLPECRNLTVIRADKLLLRVAIHRDLFGVKELGVAEDNLKGMLGRLGVHYVVVEPEFWGDLQSMKMLVAVLHQDQFKLLNTISAVNYREHNGSQLQIYENLAPLAQGKNVLKVELPVSGIAIEGTVGHDSVDK
jgi:hypothetical protein